MAAKIFRINYKSDFILTMNSEAGWTIPFCIKFWTSIPMRAYYVGYDGETYTHCAYDPAEPTKLLVQFDDHHLPIGNLHFQIAYHFTVEDFPNNTEDEVFNATAITTEIDGETYQVMLDFTGETAPGIDFNMPSVGVTSVNGKIGAVTLTAEDVGAQPTIEDLATIRSGAAAGATAVQPAALQQGLATKQDTISDLATIRSGAAAGATAVQPAALTPIQTVLQTIEAVIPSAASSQNQLADKNFVNSSISTNTANFVGTYNSLAELQAVQNPTNNDYGFVIETDAQGNEYYDRYKYVAASQQWLFEYKVESTPFTAAQWAAIQSGITSALVTKLNALPTNAELQQTLDGKADTSDIPTALSQLSQDSTHRVVTDAEKSTWNGKQNALTFDNVPTANSNNPVKSGGVYQAIQDIDVSSQISGKANSTDVYTKAQVDDMIEDVSYFGDTVGNVVTADFNAQTDTVWNKEQVLSAAQQAQARTNIGAGTVSSVTVNGTTYTPTNGDVTLGTIGGGEANVIETVKVNGTALTPDANKAVDVTVPTESTVTGWGFTKNGGTVTSTGGTVAVSNIQVVSALPASPNANTLYLIPET